MDKIESGARERHGDFLYEMTWKARKGGNKWLWAIVAIVAFWKLIWKSVATAVVAYAVVSSITGSFFHQGMRFSLWVAIAEAIIGAPVFEAFFWKRRAFAHTSNFIAIAGDMQRVSAKSRNLLGRLIAKLSYLTAGAIALYCALAIYWFHRKCLHTLSVAELDVLGTALSKGGFWNAAQKIFNVLRAHFDSESLLFGEKARQAAISYAFACKWLMRKPGMPKEVKDYLKALIQYVMEKHEIPPEVSMRLKEALG
jgi:uncharacterized MnhB-related membrane protein